MSIFNFYYLFIYLKWTALLICFNKANNNNNNNNNTNNKSRRDATEPHLLLQGMRAKNDKKFDIFQVISTSVYYEPHWAWFPRTMPVFMTA